MINTFSWGVEDKKARLNNVTDFPLKIRSHIVVAANDWGENDNH